MVLFGTGDSLTFAFDESRRLRISAPPGQLPLAAFLYTDAQADAATVGQLIGLLRRAQREAKTWLGNGTSVTFTGEDVGLESLYGTWPHTVVPQHVFFAALESLHRFLLASGATPAETGITRRASEYRNLKNGRFTFVDHTYFPPDWTPEAVSAAGTAAWSSPDVLRDPATGAWSGTFADLEIAGYHNPATGEVLTYFPVQH
ncbi:EndoU domain-containing protein [Amycolatopsis sp. NPDC047767]|uniref:EndoU domain-containing protein n=1 Tax=Amycolatopsis sp. NPDC047767 TaxID=3156765 RepID=UPI003456884D